VGIKAELLKLERKVREGENSMQCPFLFKSEKPYCETGAFGMMVPRMSDYRQFCNNRSYYLCRVYRANTGNGDRKKCLEEISSRLVRA